MPNTISTEQNGGPGHVKSEPQPSTPFDEKLQKAIDKALYAGGSPVAQQIRNFLNGVWLGDPLHVALTDVPVGAWTAAMVFDVVDIILNRREFARAADASIAVGLAGAAAAAVTGLTDWSDVDPPARQTGLTYALLNIGATALFTTSLILRKQRSRTRGRIASALGYAVMSYAAHLGGRMVYGYKVGVDRTATEKLPEQFTAVVAASELVDGKLIRIMHDCVPILLVRRGERVYGMAETCSHFGGPLPKADLSITASFVPTASRFALEDGRVLDGPAVHPQPCLEVRTQNSHIEVRKARARGLNLFASSGKMNW